MEKDQQKKLGSEFPHPPTTQSIPSSAPPSPPSPSSMTNSPSPLSPEDWDRPESTIVGSSSAVATATTTATATAAPAPSRVAFPSRGGAAGADDDDEPPTPPDVLPSQHSHRAGKRTLSELLKLHAEKGTDVHFTSEEAARLEELLGQWINSSSSPYEGDDDFFSRPHDDSIVLVHHSSTFHSIVGHPQHGQSGSIALGS